jgi:uncharacterized protein (DUF58 family)
MLFDADFLKKLEYLNLIARRLVFGRRQALRPSVKKGASIEFRDFREYTPGDDPRTIDWMAYARLGELYIKLFRQEEELDLWVLLDSSGSMNFGGGTFPPPWKRGGQGMGRTRNRIRALIGHVGSHPPPDPLPQREGGLTKFDQARRIAAALAYIGMANMDSASVVPFAGELREGRRRMRGRGQVFRLMDFLSDLEPDGQTDLPRTVQMFLSIVRRPSLVVVLSDFYGLDRAQAALDRLRFFKHQVHVIQVVSPWERDPPIRGELRLIDVESRGHEDLTITDSMLRRYKKAFTQLGEDLRRYSMRYSIGYEQARTEVAFDQFVRGLLEHGGLLS